MVAARSNRPDSIAREPSAARAAASCAGAPHKRSASAGHKQIIQRGYQTLELDPQPQPDLSLARSRVPDRGIAASVVADAQRPTEGAAGDVVVGVRPHRVVEQVEDLRPELDALVVAERECPE